MNAAYRLLSIALLMAILSTALLPPAAAAAPAAYTSVAGTVVSSGPVRQGRQQVCFTRVDVRGRTTVTVAITKAPYLPQEAIWVHISPRRVIGISHRTPEGWRR